MKYIVRKSIVRVVGEIWMPQRVCAQEITMRDHDVNNARDEEGKITRESVDNWLATHAGDFQRIIDFEASIEDGENTVEIPWATEDGEMQYNDCTCRE